MAYSSRQVEIMVEGIFCAGELHWIRDTFDTRVPCFTSFS
jgi:hypothetical protein